MMSLSQTILANPSSAVSPKDKDMMQLPAIATMQEYLCLDDIINPDIALSSRMPTNPLSILSSAIDHFPAHEAYQVGEELGIREFRSFYLSSTFKNPQLLNMQWQSVLELWWTSAYLDQYTEMRFNRIEEQGSYFVVTFMNTSNTNAAYSQPNCPLIAGILAGFLSSLFGLEFKAIETECHGQENHNCTFLLGSSGQINPTQFWQTINDMN